MGTGEHPPPAPPRRRVRRGCPAEPGGGAGSPPGAAEGRGREGSGGECSPARSLIQKSPAEPLPKAAPTPLAVMPPADPPPPGRLKAPECRGGRQAFGCHWATPTGRYRHRQTGSSSKRRSSFLRSPLSGASKGSGVMIEVKGSSNPTSPAGVRIESPPQSLCHLALGERVADGWTR